MRWRVASSLMATVRDRPGNRTMRPASVATSTDRGPSRLAASTAKEEERMAATGSSTRAVLG